MKQKFKAWLCLMFGHPGWSNKRGGPIRCTRCGKLWCIT